MTQLRDSSRIKLTFPVVPEKGAFSCVNFHLKSCVTLEKCRGSTSFAEVKIGDVLKKEVGKVIHKRKENTPSIHFKLKS